MDSALYFNSVMVSTLLYIALDATLTNIKKGGILDTLSCKICVWEHIQNTHLFIRCMLQRTAARSVAMHLIMEPFFPPCRKPGTFPAEEPFSRVPP